MTDLSITAGTWQPTTLTQFLQTGAARPQAQLWREGDPAARDPDGWKMLWEG